jgi:chromosome segregation ATPase
MMTENHADLKGLQVQKKRLADQITDIKQQIQGLNASLQSLIEKEKNINHKINNMTSKEIVISEHAILRYLERIKGINMDAIKQEILPDKVRLQVEELGNGKYPLSPECKLLVRDRTVVTILDPTENKVCA